MKLNDIKLAIISGNFSNDELNVLADSVRYARSQIVQDKKSELQVGVTVQFTSRGRQFFGTVTSIKIKNAVVDTSAGRYRVPMNMLNVAKQIVA